MIIAVQITMAFTASGSLLITLSLDGNGHEMVGTGDCELSC